MVHAERQQTPPPRAGPFGRQPQQGDGISPARQGQGQGPFDVPAQPRVQPCQDAGGQPPGDAPLAVVVGRQAAHAPVVRSWAARAFCGSEAEGA